MSKLILTLLLLLSLAPLAYPQGVLRPRSIVIQTSGDPIVTPSTNGIYSTDIILLTPGVGTSPREVRLVPGLANETIDLNLSAGDDTDDLVRIGLFNNSLDDGWRIVFDQGTASDVFRIQDHNANDAIIIDQTTLDTSFLSLANITNDHILLAGDNVDDLVRIRMLNRAGTDGWQLVFDQGTSSDVFRIQDHNANTALVIDQTNLDTSLQTLPGVLNSFGILAGDAVDDDVRILMESSDGLNGFQFYWDQSPDELRIELHDGTDLMTLDAAGITMHVPCSGCGGGLPVVDTTSIVEGSVDPTKEIRFEVGGLTTSTIRVLTPQDADYILAGTNIDNSFSVTQTMRSIVPAADLTYSLGVSLNIWSSAWIGSVNVGDTTTIGSLVMFDGISTSATTQFTGGRLVFGDDGTFNGTLLSGTHSPNAGTDDLGQSGNPWDDIWFNSEIAGGGTVGMNWLPDADNSRSLGSGTLGWTTVFITGLELEDASDNTIVELNNTTASATQIRLNDPGGTRRMNIGFFGAGDNDAAVSLLGPTAADNIAITTADAGDTAALQIGGNTVVSAQQAAITDHPADATYDTNEIAMLNEMCLAMAAHGLIAGCS